MKCRIIKRTHVDNQICYVIQQKGWFGWRDAWLNSWVGASCRDSFLTLNEARRNLCYFNDSKPKEEVIEESESDVKEVSDKYSELY